MIYYSSAGWLTLANMKWADNLGVQLGSGDSFGAVSDSKIYYNGANLIIDPDVVGTGKVYIGATADDELIASKIGINTTTPQNTLNVLGDANITGTLYYGTLDGESGLDVNSSDFWDGLDTPARRVYI